MNLLMVRHGEIPSNVKKVYAGRSPEELTPKGIKQAEEVAEKLRAIAVDAIYSSPIRRALQTAEIIGAKTGMEVISEDAFREMEMGPWEGLSEEYIALNYPGDLRTWLNRPAELRLPERETLDELRQRVLEGVRGIYRERAAGNIVIVTHVAVIRVLTLWNENKSLNLYKTIHVPNAEIFRIQTDAGLLSE